MRICHLITSLSDGGAETLVVKYAKILKNNGEDAFIVSKYKVKGTANEEKLRNYGLLETPIYKKHNIFSRMFDLVFGRFYVPYKIKKILKEMEPDIIHAHLVTLQYLSPIIQYIRNKKLFYTCHSLPIRLLRPNGKEFKAARKLIDLTNITFIALHRNMQNDLLELFGNNIKVTILTNGIDFSDYEFEQESREPMRQLLHIPKSSVVIGNIGRFVESKNQSFLLDVFFEYQKNNADSFLLLVGSGRTEKTIIKKTKTLGISEKVLILHHRTDIPQILSTMDFFVFPSLYEGLSLTLIEAQVAGLPCIISNSIDKNNVLSDSTETLELNEGPRVWANKLAKTQQVRCLVRDAKKYDLNVIVKKMISLYENKNDG